MPGHWVEEENGGKRGEKGRRKDEGVEREREKELLGRWRKLEENVGSTKCRLSRVNEYVIGFRLPIKDGGWGGGMENKGKHLVNLLSMREFERLNKSVFSDKFLLGIFFNHEG